MHGMAPAIHSQHIIAAASIAFAFLTYVWYKKRKISISRIGGENKDSSSGNINNNNIVNKKGSDIDVPQLFETGEENEEFFLLEDTLKKAIRALQTAAPIQEESDEYNIASEEICKNSTKMICSQICNKLAPVECTESVIFGNKSFDNDIYLVTEENNKEKSDSGESCETSDREEGLENEVADNKANSEEIELIEGKKNDISACAEKLQLLSLNCSNDSSADISTLRVSWADEVEEIQNSSSNDLQVCKNDSTDVSPSKSVMNSTPETVKVNGESESSMSALFNASVLLDVMTDTPITALDNIEVGSSTVVYDNGESGISLAITVEDGTKEPKKDISVKEEPKSDEEIMEGKVQSNGAETTTEISTHSRYESATTVSREENPKGSSVIKKKSKNLTILSHNKQNGPLSSSPGKMKSDFNDTLKKSQPCSNNAKAVNSKKIKQLENSILLEHDSSTAKQKARRNRRSKNKNGQRNKSITDNENSANETHDTTRINGLEKEGSDNTSCSRVDKILENNFVGYSDLQSVDSNDSGKGGSEGPISPSPTTSVGGSLTSDVDAGHVVLYQFTIPQIHVGKLIGKHGQFVSMIKAKTNTRIYIKRHATSSVEKICAIEGTSTEIQAALEIIRGRFPANQYPEITLDECSSTLYPFRSSIPANVFQLELVEGVNNDVIVSSIVSPNHLFLQQPMHPSFLPLSDLNLIMNETYNSNEAAAAYLGNEIDPAQADYSRIPEESVVEGIIVAAAAMDGWFRALVISVDENKEYCDIRFLDYGGYAAIRTTSLRALRADFLTLPFQAIECVLADVAPTGDDWSQEAKEFLHTITCGIILQAQVINYNDAGIPSILLYAVRNGQVVSINQELINNGFAYPVSYNEE